MKRFSIKKTVIGVAAACLVVGSVCVAASGLRSYTGHGSSIPDFTNFKDMEKSEKEVGYEVDAVESFSNGYQLKGIHIGEMTMDNGDGTTAGSQKNIGIDYRNGKEQIFFRARKLFEGEAEEDFYKSSGTNTKTLQCGDVKVIFSQNTYKSVPPDYVMTPEDEKQEKEGTLMIGYGASEIKTQESYYTGWIKNGIVYTLSGFDLPVSSDEMLNMAKEVIVNGN